MGRNRVLSFMSQLSNRDSPRAPGSFSPPSSDPPSYDGSRGVRKEQAPPPPPHQQQARPSTPQQQQQQQQYGGQGRNSPQAQPRVGRERASSRPQSMLQTYHPPLMELSHDTPPELQPIFTYLNSHGNKLYQEGYFLKLDDQNTQGKQNTDRTWTECFAQLVGTILSLWDAAELDAVGADGNGEVLPKFINLTDASIRMIDSLPTQSNDERPLQHVLSISTAARNRYLLHFNSHHSMIQWTAGIRLALFEHTLLQESYTGALIAGKGKTLNNIGLIMERNRIKHEDWARVRFGAGTPWRRCWCVIEPPDEKQFQKVQKEHRKKSAYNRGKPPVVKGCVKFYETKKTKKVEPIATITNAYAAYAIYPQSKPLIEASTLVKVEGSITLHSSPPTVTEGFVFVMPEVHPAVSGFEMMLRWLFPVFDTFGLYGRPQRLIAETLDARSLMFAMPRERYMSYLENLDVANLILADGSQSWREEDWRSKLKELTARRMAAVADGSQPGSRMGSRRAHRNSLPSKTRVSFGDGASIRSTPSVTFGPGPSEQFNNVPRTDSAPPAQSFEPPKSSHQRSSSDTRAIDRLRNDAGYDSAPTPPPHRSGVSTTPQKSSLKQQTYADSTSDIQSSEDDTMPVTPAPQIKHTRESSVGPVVPPPAFTHGPGAKPPAAPYHSPELRRANSRMSTTTLHQLAGASGGAAAAAGAAAAWAGAERAKTGSSERLAPEISRKMTPNASSTSLPPNPVNDSAAVAGNNSAADRPLPPLPPYNTGSALPPAGQPEILNTQVAYKVNSPTDGSSQRSPASAIARKPLPTINSARSIPTAGAQPDSIADDTIPFPPVDRSSGQSQYADASSTVSREFESPTRSSFDRASMERPRTGVMRTVGSPNDNAVRVGDVEYRHSESNSTRADIPNIDFGPTLNYASDRLPVRNQSPTRSTQIQQIQHSRQHSRSPSKLSISQTPSPPRSAPHTNYTENSPRTMAWQPGMSTMGSSSPNGRSLTPEEFVRERAAAANAPRYPHQRSGSWNRSATPPPMQNKSSDIYSQGRFGSSLTDLSQRPNSRGAASAFNYSHSRTASTDWMQRPGSRGGQSTFGTSGDGHLSAREQEHIARMSGTPLVNLNSKPDAPRSGLVGAIETREQERRDLRHNVQQQIAQQQMGQQNIHNMQQFFDPLAQQQQQYAQYPAQEPMGQVNNRPSSSDPYMAYEQQPLSQHYRAPAHPQQHNQQNFQGYYNNQR